MTNKFYDFATKEQAEQFKAESERLGFTVSSVSKNSKGGWFVITNR